MTRRFWEVPDRRKYRLLSRSASLSLGAGAAYSFAVLIQERMYGWALVPGLVFTALSVFEFVVADLLIDARFPRETSEFLDRLQTKLSTTSTHDEILNVLDTCTRTFSGCDYSRISATVHLIVDVVAVRSEAPTPGLVQISDYTRSGLGGRRWRVLEPTKGLVGRCLRTETAVTANFSDEEDYRRRMVTEYGFTRSEVDRHTEAARSYIACPIMSGSDMVGVLYFFSTEPQVFPRAADTVKLRETADVVAGFLRAAEIL